MIKTLIFLACLCLVVVSLPDKQAAAQPVISAADTFRVVNAKGLPGQVVPMQVYVANRSARILAINAFFRVDTNVVKFDGVVSQGVFFVNTQLINRGLPDVFNFQPLVMTSTDSVRSATIAAGDGFLGSIPIGSGTVFRFNVRIKDNVPLGTTTTIRIFSPNDESSDPRRCQFSDETGIVTIFPTIVSGTLEVDTGTVTPPPGEQNQPPVIATIVPNSYNVQPNTPISFTVSASDPNAPQPITLRAQGLPSGATFGIGGQVTGAGFASGTFNWTPNASQAGNYVVTFTCQDDSGATATPQTVSIAVQSIPLPTGDLLFTVSQQNIGPVSGGTPGLTGLDIPVNLSTTKAVYGIQFDFVYNHNVIIVDSLTPTDRLANFTVYENIGDSPGRIRVVAFGLGNETVQSGQTSAILHFWVTVRGSAPIGPSPLRFENAYEAISADPFIPSVELEVDQNGIFVVDAGGDVNGDGRVDIADMVIVVGYIIGQVDLNLRQFTAADMDRNNFVDVIDLQAIINQVFGGIPTPPSNYQGQPAILTLNRSATTGSDSEARLYAELPTQIAGVQVEINYNPAQVRPLSPSKTSLASKLALRYSDNGLGKMIILLYPGEKLDEFMPPGSGVLIDLPLQSTSPDLAADDLKIRYAVMVDPSAKEVPVKDLGREVPLPTDFTLSQNYPNPFNPETTIDFAITASIPQLTSLVIYNLLGQRVATLVDDVLAAGRYSYKWYGIDESGKTAASGVYFYRLTVGGSALTKKMVMLK